MNTSVESGEMTGGICQLTLNGGVLKNGVRLSDEHSPNVGVRHEFCVEGLGSPSQGRGKERGFHPLCLRRKQKADNKGTSSLSPEELPRPRSI